MDTLSQKRPFNDVASLKQLPRKVADLFKSTAGLNKPASEVIDERSPTINARISRIVKETHDTKSYYFKTKQSLNHHSAGSHINIKFDNKGETVERTYTLSSQPELGFDHAQQNEYAITVKCIEKGLASNWLFSELKVGDEINVSKAQGQFVLPYHPPGKILFLSAGSGITPVMSMLRYLSKTGNRSDIVFINYAKSAKDLIFKKEIEELTSSRSNINSQFVLETGSRGKKGGLINSSQLQSLVPDLSSRDIYMCGPQGFMKASMEIFEQLSIAPSKIHLENFTSDLTDASTLGYSSELQFDSLDASVVSSPARTILQEAEAAGLKPKSACRTGICRTCRCKKVSGTTVNLATGEESTKDNDYILPCISVAKTATHIEL
jgi:ferredoxin-NADP reductase